MSGVTVTVAPAAEPVTLADAKAHLRVSDASEDGTIGLYLAAARRHVEHYTGRALITREYAQKFDYGWPADGCGPRIELRHPPLLAVASVKYLDSTGVEQTLAQNQYLVSRAYTCGVVVPAYGVSWPAVRRVMDAITVTFTAGYGADSTTIPESIRAAVLLMVGHLYENRSASVAGMNSIELPLGIEALLATHRVDLL